MFLCTKRGLLTRQFQAFSSYMAAPIAPLQCHILYIQHEFLVQILNLAKQHNSSRTDRYSIIYVPVDLAITIAQSQPHQSVLSCELSRLGNRMFFSKKIVVAIVMFNRVLQIDPITKLRLFFASRNTTSCCPHFLNAPFYYQMMP